MKDMDEDIKKKAHKNRVRKSPDHMVRISDPLYLRLKEIADTLDLSVTLVAESMLGIGYAEYLMWLYSDLL